MQKMMESMGQCFKCVYSLGYDYFIFLYKKFENVELYEKFEKVV